MTAARSAAKPGTSDLSSVARAAGHALAWLLHAYVTVIQDAARHQSPPPMMTAALVATVVIVLAVIVRRRKAA